MQWKVAARAAENVVFVDTHPMSPEFAMDLAHRLARAAQHVRQVQDAKRRQHEPPPLEMLPSFEHVPAADADGEVTSDAPPEPPPPPPPPPPPAARMPQRRREEIDLR
jgi:hypothetical protein